MMQHKNYNFTTPTREYQKEISNEVELKEKCSWSSPEATDTMREEVKWDDDDEAKEAKTHNLLLIQAQRNIHTLKPKEKDPSRSNITTAVTTILNT